jgi:uncharacterized protein (TIGR02246 family)
VDSPRLTRWLTLGANVAVVVGIVLLIVELEQNRQQMRAQTRHELAMGIVDLLQLPAGNPQLADVLFRALTGEALTPAEQFQFELRSNALFRYWEDVHYQYRLGLYDDVEFDRQRAAWKASMGRSPMAQAYWCRVRTLYSPQFMAEMDGLLAQTCISGEPNMATARIKEFAGRYTAAWNSGVPDRVAGFFAKNATLSVNGNPATGRTAIAEVARGFMTAFPDLELLLDRLEFPGDRVRYHWTFIGSNTGPGGTGNAVQFSGYEEWTLGADGLIAHSDGHFDAEEYQRQLEQGDAAD